MILNGVQDAAPLPNMYGLHYINEEIGWAPPADDAPQKEKDAYNRDVKYFYIKIIKAYIELNAQITFTYVGMYQVPPMIAPAPDPLMSMQPMGTILLPLLTYPANIFLQAWDAISTAIAKTGVVPPPLYGQCPIDDWAAAILADCLGTVQILLPPFTGMTPTPTILPVPMGNRIPILKPQVDLIIATSQTPEVDIWQLICDNLIDNIKLIQLAPIPTTTLTPGMIPGVSTLVSIF